MLVLRQLTLQQNNAHLSRVKDLRQYRKVHRAALKIALSKRLLTAKNAVPILKKAGPLPLQALA
ncbi:hypothetical protein SDC9_73213 [bioreactor metagenome]|uniref:Uncharacterized protein n=1 Tax=bioreactor metagenome TaxID=1076179 RepID=A0A644YEI6_9ZZZZ